MLDKVYNLWFVRAYEDRDDTELHVGIYRTQADAEAAIMRLRDKPGFRDYPNGFEVHPTMLNEDRWTEGFTTITAADEGPLEIPAK